jgi:hypothetical protein
MNRDELDLIAYKHEIARIEHEYNVAYYRWVFCPESERVEAKRLLDIWRHKWFTI